jgi:hypothetical protein
MCWLNIEIVEAQCGDMMVILQWLNGKLALVLMVRLWRLNGFLVAKRGNCSGSGVRLQWFNVRMSWLNRVRLR